MKPIAPEKRRVQNAYNCIGKKWCISIICDIFSGRKRFTEFLESNPGLSTKMLAQRLAEMQKSGLVRKKYNSATSGHDYVLTGKGLRAEKTLLEMAQFSANALEKS